MFGTTLVLALLIAAPAPKDKPKVSTIPVGEWEVVEFSKGAMNIGKMIGPITMKFDEKTLTLTILGQSQTVNIEWDTTKNPGIIKSLKENTIGIFKVEEGVLTMCLNDKADMPLPEAFTAPEKVERSLMVLKKVTKKE